MDCSTPYFLVLHLTPGVCSNSRPLSQLCCPTISSSFVPFSSCLQSFPASGSFSVSWLFTSGGQSIGASASALVLPMNIQHWFPFGLIGLISCSPRDSQESSPAHQFESICSAFFMVQLSHPYMTTGKMTRWTFVSSVISLLFDMLSRFVIAFLPRSKHLLILWLQSICSDFVAQENEIWHCFHCFPIYLPWSDGTGCHDLQFLNVEF